ATALTGRTAWARNVAAPVRDFLSTETGSAAVLLAATIAALTWANLPLSGSYDSVWSTQLSVQLGGGSVSMDLRQWVNEGLMTFFFLVVGLEAKREFDVGELRERRRLAIPVVAAIGGMAVPVAIYLAFNAGRAGAHGWGAAMSTDTAFALGALALLTPRAATRLRVFLLTLAVVDDLGALIVIAVAYTGSVSIAAVFVAIALFAVLLALRFAPAGRRQASILVGIALLVALVESAASSPITLGILVGYLAGKPLGILGASWLATRPALHGPRPSLSWPVIAGGGAIAGVPFTVSLLILSLAFHGEVLARAKLGVLAAAVVAPLVARAIFQALNRMPTS